MKLIKQIFIAISIFVVLIFAGAAGAASSVLYDDTAGNKPNMQPWLFSANDSIITGGTMTEIVVNAGVNLTTDNEISAGYSNYEPITLYPLITYGLKNSVFPALNRAQGFSISFELQVESEMHISNDRAGLSVILLSDDKQGIELQFWEDKVWVQNNGFTHGEGAIFDTTAGEIIYKLTILGSNYTLSADSTRLLQGSLRDYSNFGVPYSLPGFLYLGDDTSSAGAAITLGEITLNTTERTMVPVLLLLL